jgi:hypothetical protein
VPVAKKDQVTPETFETWVRAIVADEFEKRKSLLEEAVAKMLAEHDAQARQNAVLARI